MTEHAYTTFEDSLIAGKLNEAVIEHEFEYQGVPLILPPPGKHPFDFYLPNGMALEVKLDLRSQATSHGVIEWPTLQRGADFYLHTLTYCKVFTAEQYNALYMRGKVIKDMGQLGYDGRLIPTRELNDVGMPLWQFIKTLKEQAV